MRYPLAIITGLLLTVSSVSAHPAAKFVIPGVTTLHQQKFMHLHLPGRSGQFNRFLVDHNSMIVAGSPAISGGNGNPYAMAINRTGVVSASSVIRQNGKILLTGNSNETAFNAIHDQDRSNAHEAAFLGTLLAKRQEAHDNQHVAEFLATYYSKQQVKHQTKHDTAKHNLKVYGPTNTYIEVYSSPYSEYYYY